MATLAIEDGELVLRLTGAEKLEAVRRSDLRVPLAAVRGAEVLDDAHRKADAVGVKIGTRIPRVVEVATVRAVGRTLFAAVHRDTPRGVRVRLTGAGQDEWIVGCADPEQVAAMINAAVAPA
jgi:hypothetical protein